jgi:hypothetical protein
MLPNTFTISVTRNQPQRQRGLVASPGPSYPTNSTVLSAISPAPVHVWVNYVGLSLGTYSGSVSILSRGVTVGSMAVELHYTYEPFLSLSRRSLCFQCEYPGDLGRLTITTTVAVSTLVQSLAVDTNRRSEQNKKL